ncbi:hypothetical protein D7V82_22770, partial [bacterium 1xD8-6]
MVEKYVCIVYNMLNKEADTIADTYPFPAKILVKNSTFNLSGFFLNFGCFIKKQVHEIPVF